MNFYTFRKSDGTHLYTAYNAESQVGQWAACLANEGGVTGDYIVIETANDNRPGPWEIPVTDGVSVRYERTQANIDQEALRLQTHTKLVSLGFTQAESDLLV